MMKTIRVAILDLNNNVANKGLGYLCQMMESYRTPLEYQVFDVRHRNEIPDLSFDIYLSSGGPGSPLEYDGGWDKPFFSLINQLWAHNLTAENDEKKYVFFICHSFQLACIHFGIGEIEERKSMKFGVFPVQKTKVQDDIFEFLPNPFYAADFRYFQILNPKKEVLEKIGAKILAYETVEAGQNPALMAIRFSEEMIGTQFHPEADEIGMEKYLTEDERKENIIRDFGKSEYQKMLDSAHDPEKIALTFRTILPTFLNHAIENLQEICV